jgi:hypothetical protein
VIATSKWKVDCLVKTLGCDWCAWILAAGRDLYYISNLVFTHYMPSIRLTEDKRGRQQAGFRQSSAIVTCYIIVAPNARPSVIAVRSNGGQAPALDLSDVLRSSTAAHARCHYLSKDNLIQ